MATKRTQDQPANGPDADSLSFEDALERLEQIVEKIESGEVGLEGAIQEYEQGMALIRRCRDVLARAEQRVAELAKESPEAPDPR